METKLGFTLLPALLITFGLALPRNAYGLTSYPVPCDVAALKAAIMSTNTDGDDSVLELMSGCSYTLSVADNTMSGDNGLPLIANDMTLTIKGNGATIRRNETNGCTATGDQFDFRMLWVAGGTDLAIDDLTVENFCSDFQGAAIDMSAGGTLTVMGSDFLYNEALGGSGGAINCGSCTINIGNSMFIGNRAVGTSGDGGAIRASTFDGTILDSEFRDNISSLRGGAIVVFSTTVLDIQRSAFYGNRSMLNGGAVRFGAGVLNILDSTFSENVTADGNGGALGLDSSALITNIANSTFSRNTEEGIGPNAGAIWAANSTVNITNSTFFENDGDRTFDASTGANVWLIMNTIVVPGSGTVCDLEVAAGILGGVNRIDDTSCDGGATAGFNLGAVTGLDPNLADNGGLTETHALQNDSNAIDAVNDCTFVSGGVNLLFMNGEPVTTDQRGVIRPQTAFCDIGAYEYFVEDIFSDGFE